MLQMGLLTFYRTNEILKVILAFRASATFQLELAFAGTGLQDFDFPNWQMRYFA
jgi:hypothetical protein